MIKYVIKGVMVLIMDDVGIEFVGDVLIVDGVIVVVRFDLLIEGVMVYVVKDCVVMLGLVNIYYYFY